MITVPQATDKIIKRSRYLTEALSKDLINASSLADHIHAEVEALTMKSVTRGSIIMAIKRFSKSLSVKNASTPPLIEAPDMIVRSNLVLFFVRNSPTLLQKLAAIEHTSSGYQKKALFSYGRVETVILVNKLAAPAIEEALREETITLSYPEVSSITLHLPETSVETPGIFNFFIKSLAWEQINLRSLLVTHTEVTLVFATEDIHTAFGILQSLFGRE